MGLSDSNAHQRQHCLLHLTAILQDLVGAFSHNRIPDPLSGEARD